ncbi:MSHA biogenesis protein MshM [hydrothermal vent metagenome]|uniref:MSHA biogenesis protein MshM n=1 Tax=hydrothermal vent metagenome TaxID=652676 RepID=A0A3B0X772_9ZZZZ
MYQEYFGLNRPPFKITPDTSLFFEGNQRGAALDALLYAIHSGEGIVKVVGEVGSGKTMLCRMLEVRLSNEVDVIYIANPSLSPDNILHVIAHELHLDANNMMSKVDVMQQIQTHLLKKHASNRQVVLFVEEAQSMPIDTLEEIRLLSNLETDQNKLLQMVLFGQPELDEKLSQPQIRQLKERITHSFNLSPFPQDDTLCYLNFRLRAVGYKGPDVFNKKTAGVVKKYSDGLTRRINILADKSMLAAFSENSHTVTASHVKSAAMDSEFKKKFDGKNLVAFFTVIVIVVIALIAGIHIGRKNSTEINIATTPSKVVSVVTETSAINPIQKSPKNISENIRLRIKKTQQWLVTVPDNNYSIQLFMARTSDADNVAEFLNDVPETLDFAKIYIYETVISGRAWYSVLYNNFTTQDMAITQLKALPHSLKNSEPYLRRVGAIKKDLTEQNNSD